MRTGAAVAPSWTLLTNHAAVLMELDSDPHARIRDIADRVGLTERTVQGLLKDLASEGYVTRRRVGTRYQYRLNLDAKLRRERVKHVSVGNFLAVVDAVS
jgi:DNA-binding MarR family transcriptional regulator